MNKISNKYGFDHKLVRFLVELEFDPDMYYKLKANGMLYSYDFVVNRNTLWETKERGKLHVILMYSKALQGIFYMLGEKIEEESSSYDLSSN